MLVLLWGLAGCAALPNVSQRPWDDALPQARTGPLAQLAADSISSPELSGLRLIVSGTEALQARLVLIEQARFSLDLQAYQFKGDATGRMLMRALREAAGRGVRVRVLLDDLYTAGDDALWLGLASSARVEVRLFNPFLAGRESHLSRLVEMALGDERMQRRMHNKMLVADGVLAIAGGRNIADAYFLPLTQGSFVDIDVLMGGALVAPMVLGFDLYWNSDYSHALHTVVDDPMARTARQASFAEAIEPDCGTPECAAAVAVARAPSALRQEFDRARLTMHLAQANVAYDSPAKVANEAIAIDIGMLATLGSQVRLLMEQAMQQVQYEIVIVSPYLIPGPAGVAALGELCRRAVRVTLLTNSLAATDVPMAHLGYRKYRAAILGAGVELYEWSPARGGRVLRELLAGGPVLRLHAKAAIIDRQLVFLGSMNFDPRSRDLNTEFGLLIRSPELAEELHALVERLRHEGSHRLHLDTDGRTLHWTLGESELHAEEFEPGTDFGSRLLLDLLDPLVPEQML